MDVRSGRIYTAEQAARIVAADMLAAEHLRPMRTDPTAEQLARGRVGRNDRCPCGSGKKLKKCCLARMGYPRRNPTRERLYVQTLAADEIAAELRKPLPVVTTSE
jgi:hypothetical protein